MKFIRENLFYLIVVAAVIVLGAVLLIADSSIHDDITVEIEARADLARTLQGFAGGNLVNPRIVDEANRAVTMVRGEANAILKQQTQRNQLPYKVLLLPVIDPNGHVKQLQPAFPYDARLYSDYELAVKFVSVQRAAFGERLGTLQPTRPPTPADIQVALGLLLARPPAGMVGAAGDLSARLLPKATDYAIFEKAVGGCVYVDDAIAAEVCFPASTMVNPEADALWRKQYKLWIATDVMAAIKAANEEVLLRLPNKRDRTVLNAPVKRWVSLHVLDTYATKGGQTADSYTPPQPAESGGESEVNYGGAAPGGEDRRSGPGPMRGPGGGGPGPMRGPGADYGGGGGSYGGGGGGPIATAVQATGETVTQHYSDQEKDVLSYTFHVVMPTRHVPLLMKTLMQDRNHTVLMYKAQEVPKAALYFYGNEPVMLVTFTCEAVFLTSWERDLVPPGFLRTLPGALRDKDKERLK